MDIEQLGYQVIGCAIEAHRTLGWCGLLESIYEDALAYELASAGIPFSRQELIRIKYKDTTLGSPLRIDLFINRQIIVECKATIDYNPIFEAQLLTYMRLSNVKLGYIINFGEAQLKDGVHRVVNGL